MSVSPTEAGGNGVDGHRQPVHDPVLPAEVLAVLALSPGLVVVDGTVGAGGHAIAIARALGPTGFVLGLDRDGEILQFARERFAAAAATTRDLARSSLHHLPFSRMREALAAAGLRACDRVLLDLGVSSLQLDKAERGFSFMADGPLDMRMDTTAALTAAAWLQRVPEAELARVLFEYGGERHSRRIARAIVAARQKEPLRRTLQLAEVIRRALPPAARRQRIHPATRSFQAIRIAVNDELGELERGLASAWECLGPGGRLAVITFHSVEDRLVKQFLRARGQVVTKKPVAAGAAEVARNPRARSARLRCAVVPEPAA